MTSLLLRKAETSLKSARVLLELGDTDGACSRAYYAMYDAARACLVWAGIAPTGGAFKSHQSLISAFGRHMVKPGVFPADVAKAFHNVQTLRLIADHEAAPVPLDKAEQALAAAEAFVTKASSVIAKPSVAKMP